MTKKADSIDSLKPDKRNARKHNDRNIEMIQKSLEEVGTGRSIVIDENDNILAGNGTIEAFKKAGMSKIKIIDADGDTIIAVRRKGLTEEQKKKLALYDNRTAELAEWDIDILKGLEAEIDLDFLEMNIGGIDVNKEWEGMPEFNQEDKTSFQSIHIHLRTQDDIYSFASLIGQKITDKTRSLWFPAAEIERYADKRYSDES